MAKNLFNVDPNEVVSLDEFSGGTDTSKFETAISQIGSQTGVALFVPGGSYTVEDQLSEITGANFKIFGDGPATQINLASGANLFRFGSSGSTANRGLVGGFRLNITDASPDPDDYAFDWANCSDVVVDLIWINDGCCFASFNSPSGQCSRNSVGRFYGNLNKGLSATGGRIFLGKCASTEVKSGKLSGDGASTGSLFRLAPPSGDLDTFDIDHVTLQSWVTSTDLDGAAIGVEIDYTNGNVQNGAIRHSVADHTTEYGFKVHSSSGTKNLTDVEIFDLRNDADEGRNGLVSHGGTGTVRGLQIVNSHFFVADSSISASVGPAIVLESPGGVDLIGARFDNNTILETTNATKPSAIKVGANGFKVRNNHISRSNLSGFASGWTAAIETTAGLTDCEITGNDGAAINGSSALSHASYSAVSNERVIRDNIGPNGPEHDTGASIASAATVDLATTADRTVTITGTTTITSFGTDASDRTEKTLIFSGAVQLTHSATLVLPGATNYTTSAGDILRARRTSAGWEILDVLDSHVTSGGRALLSVTGEAANRIPRFSSGTAADTIVSQSSSDWITMDGAINWTAGTDPSDTGTAVEEYWWEQIGSMVHGQIYLEYDTAGATVTACTINFPSALPAPELPTDVVGGYVFGVVSGALSTAPDATPASSRSLIKRNSGNTVNQFQVIATSGSYSAVNITFKYRVA